MIKLLNVPAYWKVRHRRWQCSCCQSAGWSLSGDTPSDHDKPNGSVCKPKIDAERERCARIAEQCMVTFAAIEPMRAELTQIALVRRDIAAHIRAAE